MPASEATNTTRQRMVSAILFFKVEAASRHTVAITCAVVAGRSPKIKSCTSGSVLYF
ncbi:hypothetical protein SAMN05660816_02991 [Niastella yeongjuensis]|nr:hypothetical protein [Niastella yeongjuensis]SEO54699.1 hypothetical protein SAMN05660816_02991 [Niastella yeongjuensis]